MLQFRGFRCLGIVVLALLSSWASAKTLTNLDAVHKSAQLRTLAVRVAREHVQLAVGNNDSKVWQQLTTSVARYDEILGQLQANATGPNIKYRLQDLQNQWRQFKTMAMAVPSRDSVLAMLDASNNLMVKADGLMWQWQSRLPVSRGDMDTLALQQGMLSERIGLFDAAMTYGLKADWVRKELRITEEAYDKDLKLLQAGAHDQQDVRLLGLLQNQWHYVRQSLQQSPRSTQTAAALKLAMESLYTKSNQLGERFHNEDRLAMNTRPVPGVGLAAYVTNE